LSPPVDDDLHWCGAIDSSMMISLAEPIKVWLERGNRMIATLRCSDRTARARPPL
jgi:hypothetical protein